MCTVQFREGIMGLDLIDLLFILLADLFGEFLE